MNILQILPSLEIGGVETGTIDLSRYLVEKGHKSIVVSGGGRLVKELDLMGARHYNLPVGKKSVINVIRMSRELAHIIRAEEIDIVHARSRVPGLIAFIACKLTNRPFITTAHGYYKKHYLSSVMGWGKYVIVASNVMAKHMATDFRVPYERIRLIPRGVDLKKFPFRDPMQHSFGEFTIGMVSRITPLKGHADFIKAVNILNRQMPRLKVVIIGSAPKDKYKEDLDILIRRFGLTRVVEFAGAAHDVPAVMKKLDLLVSATVTPEAFGRVIIEAQASGVPVVATRVGGVVDVVEDGRTGLLCNPQDPKDMAEKILKLYRSKDLWEKLAKEGRRSVEEKFLLNTMTERTIAVYDEALKSKNMLVIKMSAIGDVILSVPSLRAIREANKDARIKLLVGVESREALDRCPYIDDMIVCDFKHRDKGIKGLLNIATELRRSCFDIVIDLQNNKRSHALALLSLAPLRYGYDNRKWSFFLNRKIKDDAPYLDPIEHQFRTLKLAGIKCEDKHLELWPGEAEEKAVEAFLAENWIKPDQPIIGINIRASSKWSSKNWPVNYIAGLCDKFAKDHNMRVVLTGSKGDVEYAQRIASIARSKPVIAAGRTLILELAALIKRCKVYLTPDSAPLHIAAAVGTPIVALFGPTDPTRHAPPAKDIVILKKELKCSPCYDPKCAKQNACMREITIDEVYQAMKGYVDRQANESTPRNDAR